MVLFPNDALEGMGKVGSKKTNNNILETKRELSAGASASLLRCILFTKIFKVVNDNITAFFGLSIISTLDQIFLYGLIDEGSSPIPWHSMINLELFFSSETGLTLN